ncbi:MAG: hypothetical protein IJN04_01745 [Clostridia bacterium]|nr:hypothetical protein [Clostridia bacterium]
MSKLSLTPTDDFAASDEKGTHSMHSETIEPIAEETLIAVPPSDAETAAQTLPVEEPDETVRLAEEFLTLAEEFPLFVSPAQLPDGVLDMAAEQHISLLDAYLRYRWQEEKKVAQAAEKRQQAAARSAGSLSRGAAETPPEQDAFLRAFRAAL